MEVDMAHIEKGVWCNRWDRTMLFVDANLPVDMWMCRAMTIDDRDQGLMISNCGNLGEDFKTTSCDGIGEWDESGSMNVEFTSRW